MRFYFSLVIYLCCFCCRFRWLFVKFYAIIVCVSPSVQWSRILHWQSKAKCSIRIKPVGWSSESMSKPKKKIKKTIFLSILIPKSRSYHDVIFTFCVYNTNSKSMRTKQSQALCYYQRQHKSFECCCVCVFFFFCLFKFDFLGTASAQLQR